MKLQGILLPWVLLCAAMNKNINLYPRKNKKGEKKKKIEFFLRMGSIVMLISVAFGAAILFFLQSQSAIPSLKEEEQSLISKLSSQHGKTAKYLLINDRLRSITDLTRQRYPMDQLYTVVTEQLPSRVVLNGFSVEKKILVVSASSSSLEALNTFIENTSKLVKDKKFLRKLTLNSLGYDLKSSAYSLTLEADLL